MTCPTHWLTRRPLCRFEARFDIGPAIADAGALALGMAAEDFDGARIIEAINATRAETYVCDVCTQCGKQVMRPEKPT